MPRRCQKGRSTGGERLALAGASRGSSALLFEEKITAGHARAILSIPTKEGRERLTRKLVEEKLSVREAEALARLFSGKKNENAKPKAPMPKEYRKVARTLKDVLDTPVKVKSVNGKNKIEIEFKDEEDLERPVQGYSCFESCIKGFRYLTKTIGAGIVLSAQLLFSRQRFSSFDF